MRLLRALPVVIALGLATSGSAQATDKIRVMVGGIEKIIYLPLKLADQLGAYKAEGLAVEMISVPAGVQAENELLAGAVEAVVGSYDHTIDIQAKNKSIETIVQFSQVPGEVELVATKLADKIKTPADLKGHTLGVTGLGSLTHFLSEYLVTHYGLQPGDVSYLGVGAGNTFIAAMMKGEIDAGMTTEPTVSIMVKRGQAKILSDMTTAPKTIEALGGLYPGASLYMRTDWVAAHWPATQKLANALVAALQFIATHSAEEIADKMPKDYWAGDKPTYVSALTAGRAMFTADGTMPAGGPEMVLKVQSAFNKNVAGAKIDLAKTYTNEFAAAAAAAAAK